MDPSSWQIVLLFLLVCLSAFFSSAETAFTSVNRLRLRHLMDEGNRGAKRVFKLAENPSKLLSTILIGNNFVNIAASALATSIAITSFGSNAVLFATATMTIIVIIFGEITPKSFASQYAESVAIRYSKPIGFLMMAFTPLVFIFYTISSFIISLFGGNIHRNHPLITEEELKTMVDVGSEEGVFQVEQKEMLINIFDFKDLQVKDVMVQRVDISAIDIDADFEEVRNIITAERFSRFPVYREDIDDIIGILNVKDLLFLDEDQKATFDLQDFIREAYFTYEFKKITELFRELKVQRTHMAVILDEYGGTVGIATIEDLLEEIVGEIDDEFDDEGDADITVIRENEFIVSGSYRIDELNEEMHTAIESEEFDSIGGYLIGILGTFPENGEVVETEDLRFLVEEVDKNRIKKIRIFVK